jgi:DNA-binding GntR family transcriptional regulator
MQTRRDFAYAQLRELLRRGRFRPGDRIAEVALSQELQVSRGPLREAIHQLASEGLLTRSPGLGAFVPKPGPEELLEIYEVRAALEAFAAAQAAEQLTARDVERLQLLAAEMDALARETREAARWTATERLRLLDLDEAFHTLIVESTGNGRLTRLLADHSLLKRVLSYGDSPGSGSTHESRREAAEEHRAIAAAIAARDGVEATACMRRHIASAARNALRSLASLEGARR